MEILMTGEYRCRQKKTTFIAAIFMTATVCFTTIMILNELSDPRNRSKQAEKCQFLRPRTTNKQILLVTYGRSGSTFTSALIKYHDEVFFVFEPLYGLRNMSNKKEDHSVAMVRDILNCDFLVEYVNILSEAHRHLDFTKDFYKCLLTRETGLSHVKCIIDLQKFCRDHEISFIKTIRFHVKWAETLLAENPNFKMLYLVRDPRATLYSQATNFQYFDWKLEIKNISTYHCSLLENDLRAFVRLKQLFPGQVKAIRYEQGALDPFSYTKDIYTFLGLPYTQNVTNYVSELTSSSRNDSIVRQPYSVVRKNSSKTMDTWRFVAGYRWVSEIDSVCGHLYPKLGYRLVHSQQDLKSNRSLVDAPEPGGIFS